MADLIDRNPFLEIIAEFHSLTTSKDNTDPRFLRVQAVSNINNKLINDSYRSLADMMLRILAERAYVFYHDKITVGCTNRFDNNVIFDFMLTESIDDQDFLFICERAALFFEEINGDTSKLEITKAKESNSQVHQAEVTITILESILRILDEPLVSLKSTKDGLTINIPIEICRKYHLYPITYNDFTFLRLFSHTAEMEFRLVVEYLINAIQKLLPQFKDSSLPITELSNYKKLTPELLIQIIATALDDAMTIFQLHQDMGVITLSDQYPDIPIASSYDLIDEY